MPVSTSDPPCRIIALFNQAGGVAKSTLTQNLGYHLAKRKHRVLLIDIDPQASLTKFMGLVPTVVNTAIENTASVQASSESEKSTVNSAKGKRKSKQPFSQQQQAESNTQGELNNATFVPELHRAEDL